MRKFGMPTSCRKVRIGHDRLNRDAEPILSLRFVLGADDADDRYRVPRGAETVVMEES